MKYLRNILLILCLTMLYACDDDAIKIDGGYAACEDRTIVKMLKNEQAYIRKSCFEYTDRQESFYFDLAAEHSEFYHTMLMPCESIPEEYQIEGLSVKIGGNVTSCMTSGGCSEPYYRLISIHIFELRTIKINKQ